MNKAAKDMDDLKPRLTDDLLARLLGTSIQVSRVGARCFEHPQTFPSRVVSSGRLILLADGAIHYVVEHVARTLCAPALLFVPPWVRREWSLPDGESCNMYWCEFLPRSFEPSARSLLWRIDADWELEKVALLRMRDTSAPLNPPYPRPVALLLEGELKAMLARFFCGSVQSGDESADGAEDAPRWSPQISAALCWIEGNYRSPTAGADLKRACPAGHPGFRQAFRNRTGMTPAACLHAFRMRYARFLLDERELSIKEIAGRVGFNDPLYFSRRYRAFWGHPPKVERL